MNNIKELDAVALTCDLPEHRLKRGDVGVAVLVHGNGEAFDVEFEAAHPGRRFDHDSSKTTRKI